MSPHNDPSNSGNRKEEAADDMELDVTFELGVVKMKKMIGKDVRRGDVVLSDKFSQDVAIITLYSVSGMNDANIPINI